MSDEQPPADTPPPETPAPAPVAPQPSPSPLASRPSPASSAPIDYAMPAQKKSWLPTPERVRQVGCLLKLVVGFTVLIIMGYFALVALNPKARQWALQGTKAGPNGAPPSGKGPTPFKLVNQVLAIPAQALGKTDDVVKANNARVGQLDGVIADEEKAKSGKSSRNSRPVIDPFSTPAAGAEKKPAGASSTEAEAGAPGVSSAAMLALAEKQSTTSPATDSGPSPLPPRPSPQAPAAPETPDQMKLAGDIIIAQASPAGAPKASAGFFYAIVKLNISGITQGTQGKPSRALINNRLAYEGDEINRALGIIFAQLDAANKLLVFKDASGATVTRSY